MGWLVTAFPSPIEPERLVPVPLTPDNDQRGIGPLGCYHPIARTFLQSMPWHNGIVADYFGGGQLGLGAAFLFEVVSRNPNVPSFVWIVAGDMPAIYMVVDRAPNWVCAFDVYRRLALDWIYASVLTHSDDSQDRANQSDWGYEI